LLDAEQESRLRLSEQLLEMSQHSSEMEMRESLSRMYYAVHHAARILVGRGKQKQGSIHADVIRDLKSLDPFLGEQVDRLSAMRRDADYEPDFIQNKYGGIEQFRVAFRNGMQQGAETYQRIRELIASTDSEK
jgi:uncharacterized protein (UPF0332 family)